MEITASHQPLVVLDSWLKEASQHPHIKEPTAMTVATVGGDGSVHARVVLCKQWSEEGLTFFTNYQSRKGLDLQKNPNAAAVFYWDPLFRQVKISGVAAKTSRAVSERYWETRPRASQLSQSLSRQSQEAPPAEVLRVARQNAENEFRDRKIPCPPEWGGYILCPQLIEFWVGQPGRWHDRYEFEKTGKLWTFRRLYP